MRGEAQIGLCPVKNIRYCIQKVTNILLQEKEFGISALLHAPFHHLCMDHLWHTEEALSENTLLCLAQKFLKWSVSLPLLFYASGELGIKKMIQGWSLIIYEEDTAQSLKQCKRLYFFEPSIEIFIMLCLCQPKLEATCLDLVSRPSGPTFCSPVPLLLSELQYFKVWILMISNFLIYT